jgi:uridine kinase
VELPGPVRVHLSVSTWQQPLPPPASAHRSAVLRYVAGRILACGDGRLRVGIDGLTAAGKTSLANELAERVSHSAREVLRASLDDFKRPWADRHLYDRESGEGYYRNAFDYAAVRTLLLDPAAADGSGDCVLCSRDPLTQVDHSTVVTRATRDAVLIVDGVFAFRPEINDCWDFRIWLDIDPEMSVHRGTLRDQGTWAGTDAKATHRDRYLVAERIYIDEVNPTRLVDIAIDNSTFDSPRIMHDTTRPAPSE